MSNQNLIIYKLSTLYNIFEELALELNFNIIYEDSEKLLYDKINNFSII